MELATASHNREGNFEIVISRICFVRSRSARNELSDRTARAHRRSTVLLSNPSPVVERIFVRRLRVMSETSHETKCARSKDRFCF